MTSKHKTLHINQPKTQSYIYMTVCFCLWLHFLFSVIEQEIMIKLLCSFLPFLAFPLPQACFGIFIRTKTEQLNLAISSMTTNNMSCCVSCKWCHSASSRTEDWASLTTLERTLETQHLIQVSVWRTNLRYINWHKLTQIYSWSVKYPQ